MPSPSRSSTKGSRPPATDAKRTGAGSSGEAHRPEMSDTGAYFKILQGYDSPTVANVIELFDVRPRNEGYMDRRIRACFPDMAPICGYATTATFRSARPAAA